MIENIITGVVLTSICVLGILGNSVTLIVLNSNHQMRNQPINLYLTVLALFDNGVLFNAILMLGIPGIYKLMHEHPDASAHSFVDEESDVTFPGDNTFSPTPISGRSVLWQRDLSKVLSALSSNSSSAGSPESLKVSPLSAYISSLSSSSSLSPSASSVAASSLVTSAATQYPVSHSVLRTFDPARLKHVANYAPAPSPRSSFHISSSASSHASPSSSLLHVTSPDVSDSATLTTGSRRRRRRKRKATNDADPISSQLPPHAFSAPSSAQQEYLRASSRDGNSHPEVNSAGASAPVSFTASSDDMSSTSSIPVLVVDDSVESQAGKRDFLESGEMGSLNQTVVEQWGIFPELINSWDSLGIESNHSAAQNTSSFSSPTTILSDEERKLKSLSAVSKPYLSSGGTQDLDQRDSSPSPSFSYLLFHEPLIGPKASSVRRETQGHDPQGSRDEDRGTANSRLSEEEPGLFAGDEVIFPPSTDEEEMDLMSSNSSASEGPLHLYIQFVYPMALISQTGSIWTTCLITAERYFAIAHPLRALTLSTRKRATWALITMSILAVLYNLPRFAEVEIVGATEDAVVKNIIRPSDLRSNRVYYWVYYICIYLAVLYIIPLTLLSVLNTKIYLAIKRANRDRSSLTQNQQSEMNIATMLVFLVAIFIACNLPAFIVNCLELVHNNPYFHIAMIFSNFLVCFNSSVNFVIYCTFGKKFRERLHETLCCSSGRLPRRSTPIRNRKTSIVAETLV